MADLFLFYVSSTGHNTHHFSPRVPWKPFPDTYSRRDVSHYRELWPYSSKKSHIKNKINKKTEIINSWDWEIIYALQDVQNE